jgi:hypothetical protein
LMLSFSSIAPWEFEFPWFLLLTLLTMISSITILISFRRMKVEKSCKLLHRWRSGLS